MLLCWRGSKKNVKIRRQTTLSIKVVNVKYVPILRVYNNMRETIKPMTAKEINSAILIRKKGEVQEIISTLLHLGVIEEVQIKGNGGVKRYGVKRTKDEWKHLLIKHQSNVAEAEAKKKLERKKI